MPGGDLWTSPPSKPTASGLADWAEAQIFLDRIQSLSRAEIEDWLSSQEYDDLDAQVDLLLREIGWRASACDRYPFRMTRAGDSIVRRAGNHELYELLLLMSISPTVIAQPKLALATLLFERIVTEALRSYFGRSGKSVRFGYPPEQKRPTGFPTAVPRPTGFPKAVSWLGVDLMQVPPSAAPPVANRNDGELDVAGWLTFADGRDAFAAVLVQATIARTGWAKKAAELARSEWREWLGIPREPLTAFAIPFVVSATDLRWRALGMRSDVILDRLRLVRLVAMTSVPGRTQLRTWLNAERAELRG